MSKIIEIIKNFNVQLALKNIFTKIDEIIKKLNDLEENGSVYGYNFYNEVDITSSEILSLGTSRVELLPTLTSDKYYDVGKIILEYTHVTTPYSLSSLYVQTFGQTNIFFLKYFIEYTQNKIAVGSMAGGGYIDSAENIKYSNSEDTNKKLELGTYNNINPTVGDGTLKVKIWYNIHTFG